MKELLKNNHKKILKFIIASFSYICISTNLSLNNSSYNVNFLLFYFLFLYFISKINISKNNRTRKYSIILSLFSSLILSLGLIVYQSVSSVPGVKIFNIFNIKRVIKFIMLFLSYFYFLYFFFNYLLEKIKKFNIYETRKKKYTNKNFFISSMLFIIVCYLPYYLICYPAIMSVDSFVQISFVETGTLNNFHPLVQTWFFGFIYNIGKFIFGPGNGAIAFYIIIQIILLSSLYSLVVTTLYKNNVKFKICICVLLFYALSPLNAFYSVTLWKDILFSANFILIMFSLKRLIDEGTSNTNILLFVLSLLILVFFRNNGIYIFIVMIPLILLNFKNEKLKIGFVCTSVLFFYFLITGPIYNKFHVEQTKSVEAYSVPLQQIARVIKMDSSVAKNKVVKKFINTDYVKQNYVTYIADPVKNSVNYNYFNDNKKDFLLLWTKLLIKYPRIYIDSYLLSTLGYWYPNVDYFSVGDLNSETDLYNAKKYSISNNSKLPDTFKKLLPYIKSHLIPFSILIWSCGLYCFIFLISFIIYLYNDGKRKYFLLYSPLIGLWLTNVIASPVYSELRYVYGIFVTMPIIMLLPFINRTDNT